MILIELQLEGFGGGGRAPVRRVMLLAARATAYVQITARASPARSPRDARLGHPDLRASRMGHRLLVSRDGLCQSLPAARVMVAGQAQVDRS